MPPQVELTEHDLELLEKYGDFYRSLYHGTRTPTTPAQAHFVDVCRGRAQPETMHEKAYITAMTLAGAFPKREETHRNAKQTARLTPPPSASKKRRTSKKPKQSKKGRPPPTLPIVRVSRQQPHDSEQRQRMAREAMRQRTVVEASRVHSHRENLLQPQLTERGIPEHEEGFPQAGWFTDEDYRKLHSRYDGGGN